ncbi:MAG: flagellar hook-length control protein FliK, partial [Comamonadaceae bacterium]|nr:flagellar hook-length control protein FliK [Comamonadaceae bacterium]
MAEQVAFWVDQNNQSAEMTLDRDGEPVQVRVSVSGNEAHVVFRSDQVQTRDALDASMAQLRELLQSQGLVLAGATVDSSASGSGQREPGQRQGGQPGRAQVAVPGVEGVVGGARAAAQQQGRPGLDVFV